MNEITRKPLVENTPTIGVTYDKYGHCVLCHKYLIVEKIVNGKAIEMFSGQHDQEEYFLNSGSRMKVTICKTCKVKDFPSKTDDIMKSVIKGWQVEINHLDWPEEKKKAHMERYNKKKILFKTSGLSNDVINRKFKEFKKNEIGE